MTSGFQCMYWCALMCTQNRHLWDVFFLVHSHLEPLVHLVFLFIKQKNSYFTQLWRKIIMAVLSWPPIKMILNFWNKNWTCFLAKSASHCTVSLQVFPFADRYMKLKKSVRLQISKVNVVFIMDVAISQKSSQISTCI